MNKGRVSSFSLFLPIKPRKVGSETDKMKFVDGRRRKSQILVGSSQPERSKPGGRQIVSSDQPESQSGIQMGATPERS